ncbi:MAG: hypothetical protein AUK47_25435 [Deltaproteobacteria bacterium CG2_30_63_29]|nr:MAG: hypothetical protein AUK47_25435 [Deltaproteobacteria bacterium CG2_30_63_29]
MSSSPPLTSAGTPARTLRASAEPGSERNPIDALEGAFLDRLGQRRLVVVAPTGSGKSTRLPVWMHAQLGGPILVVEPRRVACRSLATYLAEQRGEAVGEHFGYRVRFDDCSGPRTQILFVTTGVALRLLASDDWPFVAVLIDEFHERSWEVDLVVTLLMGPHRASQGQPLVFTSATLDVGPLTTALDAEALETHGRSYPVVVSTVDSVAEPSGRDLEVRVCDALAESLREFPEDRGEILVFLPGKAELERTAGALQGLARQHDLELVPVHGTLPPEQLMRAFRPGSGRRRVFLSTNVAETSVTLPGVTLVVDSGLERRRIHRGGRSALALVPISQASMEQRAGRAGRVAAGRCVRLWSRAYRAKAETTPEIERVELDDLLLRAAACGLFGGAFDAARWVSAPPAFAVERARERARRRGTLDADGRLTKRGHSLLHLPVGALEAMLLVDPPPALAGGLADLVALLERSGDLFLPLPSAEAERQTLAEAREALLSGVGDEVFAQLRALRFGHPRRHGLHGTRLSEARALSARLRADLGAPPDPTLDLELPDPDALVAHLLERWPEAGFVMRPRAQKVKGGKEQRGVDSKPWSNGELELQVRDWEPPYPARDERRTPPTCGLLLGHFWLAATGTQVRGIGRLLLPCSPRRLFDAGLGEVEVEAAKLVKERGNVHVVASVRRSLAGVVLHAEEQELEGVPLRTAVAGLILEGRLFKGAAAAFLDQLHLWRLAATWPDAEWRRAGAAAPSGEPVVFLQQRLEQLGLESCADLSLLNAGDFLVDLEAELGAPAWELEKLATDFPREWSHQGRNYGCTVRPLQRKVILEPLNGEAKRAPEPAAQFVPRFRGFSVEYVKASRRVMIRG